MSKTMSLENLTSSIYGGTTAKKHSTEAFAAFKNAGAAHTLFESCESVEYYAIAATESYGQGMQLASYADLAFESLMSNIAILSKMNNSIKARGVENFKFSTESINIKGIIQKVFVAIKAAIQRFITAVANFIKSISNWFGSLAVSSQDKLYQKHKANIGKYLSANGNEEINTIKPYVNYSELFDSKAMFSGIDELIESANEGVAEAKNITSKIKNDASKMTKEEIEDGVNEIKEAVAEAISDIAEEFTDGKNIVSKYIEGNKIKSIPSGNTLCKLFMYRNETAKAYKIKDLYKAEDFAMLTKEHANNLKEAVNTAKKSSASMNTLIKAMNEVVKAFADTLGNTDAVKGDKDSPLSASNLTQIYIFIKNIHGFTVSFLLSYYGCYLKERSVMTRALKIIAKESGTATTEKKE